MNKKYTYLIIVLIVIACLAAYSRILGNGFVNYDDGKYITENNHIKAGINSEIIKWAFTAVVNANWHPLTLLSYTLDWSLFGANASGHHLINLLLHIGSVFFLFFLLKRMTKNLWSSAFVTALFALHPLRVESVAWAAERKDVLSMFFGIASIYAYACYAESYKLSKYLLCLILFALGLMAKPMLVTLPFVLLLLDYWPLGRWQKNSTPVNVPVLVNTKTGKEKNKQFKADSIKEEKISTPLTSRSPIISFLLLEKAPFIFLAIVSSIVTLWAQNKDGAVTSMENLPFLSRVLNAIISYVFYLGKTFWPVDLSVFYPYESYLPLWQLQASCFILIGITIVVIYAIKKLPFLFVGWFWYLGTMIPVIGLVQVGGQAMADRYTYLPSIGIAIMLAWGIPLLFTRADIRKKILFPAAIAALSIMAFFTWKQCGYWKNGMELFKHALHVTKDNFVAHNCFAVALIDKGRFEEAIEHYNKAIRLAPDYVEAFNNRGIAYTKLGRYQMAIEDYNKAIHLKPDNADIYYNRGGAYTKLGQYQMAIEDFNKAIHLEPDDANTYNNRGTIYTKLGQYQMAIEDFNKAIHLKPDDADAYNNRGSIYTKLGQYQMAIEDFNNAIRLKPDDADTYFNRGFVYFNQGNIISGCEDAKKACKLGNCKILEAVTGKGLCRR